MVVEVLNVIGVELMPGAAAVDTVVEVDNVVEAQTVKVKVHTAEEVQMVEVGVHIAGIGMAFVTGRYTIDSDERTKNAGQVTCIPRVLGFELE